MVRASAHEADHPRPTLLRESNIGWGSNYLDRGGGQLAPQQRECDRRVVSRFSGYSIFVSKVSAKRAPASSLWFLSARGCFRGTW